jgi:tRNA threonylcarbamoyl adenosine modification protein (Sua5/YciO/YrdC/YwlC family)
MAQLLTIHPDNPQQRLVSQVVDALHAKGTVIVYPTDSGYALGCAIGDADGLERIRRIRDLDKHHNFTLICNDLSELANYAQVSNPIFRLLRANTPGPYTFILPATKEVPKKLQHEKRRTIGLRIPQNNIALAIVAELSLPLMSVSLIMPGETAPLGAIEEIIERLDNLVDIIVDGGFCGIEPTTVIDFSDDTIRIARKGKGDVTPFL